MLHCLNLRIFPNTGKYGPEKYPYLDTFHIVLLYRMKQNRYQIFHDWYLNNISVESKILAFWNFTSTSLISWCCLHVSLTSLAFWHVFNPLNANLTKWPNILKHSLVFLTILWNWRLKGEVEPLFSHQHFL